MSESVFSRQAFEAEDALGREELCEQLATEIAKRLSKEGHEQFLVSLRHVVDWLRHEGHDLWSHDASDDHEVWGCDYIKRTGPGIRVTAYFPDDIEVDWWPNH